MIQKIKTFIKELFTKADKTDRVITFENGCVGLKDPLPPYRAEPSDDKMMLKSKDLGNGKYEVGGVVFYADSHAEACRKYKRGAKHGEN